MQKYVFRKYDPKYPSFFLSEKKKIIKALGPKVRIEHIGSTAVPGLGGKGIIDIILGISKLKFTEYKKKLEKAGYEFREIASFPERLFFRRDYPYNNRKRRVHLHLVAFNGKDWKETIGFRDYLSKNPDAVKKYTELKKEAFKKAQGDGEKYKKYKEKFIKYILKGMGIK